MAGQINPTAKRKLLDFLVAAFTNHELYALVTTLPTKPGDSALASALPSRDKPPDEFVEAVVTVLDKRHLIDATFFARLAEERSRRVGEIRSVAALVVDRPASAEPEDIHSEALPVKKSL